MKRPAGLIFVLSVAAASAAALAAGVAAYVVQPAAIAEAHSIELTGEPQISNAIARSDREALLRDSSSYTNFDAALLALAVSMSTSRPFDADNTNGFLSDGQIAGIASRLQLTAQQAAYWPPVAEALHDIGRKYFQATKQRKRGPKVDKDSPEVKRLVETAVPLILQLTEAQKREVRQLVRIIGMEQVASRI